MKCCEPGYSAIQEINEIHGVIERTRTTPTVIKKQEVYLSFQSKIDLSKGSKYIRNHSVAAITFSEYPRTLEDL